MKFKKLVECKSAPCHLPEDIAKAVDEIVANLPKEKVYDFRRKAVFDVVKEADPTGRTDVSYISTPSIDVSGEIVDPSGFDFSMYDKSRVVLWMHDKSAPCGTCLWYKPDGTNGVLAKTVYPAKADDQEGEWLPDKVWGLVKGGIVRGKSIGGIPLDFREPTDEERSKGCELVLTKFMMVEYSVVTTPCCPDAIVQSVQKGLAVDLLSKAFAARPVGKVRQRQTRIVKKDRRPEFVRAVQNMTIDADAIADRIIHQLRNRGKV